MLSGLTYNVFLGRNLDALLAWLFDENESLDFYCFQEFPEHRLRDLKKHFASKGYGFCFAPGFTWRGVTYGELTLFNRGKMELVETKTLSLGGKGESTLIFIREGLKFDVRIAKIQIDKTALLTTFRYQGERFSLANTHLSADIYNARKLRQLKIVLEALANEERTIVLGDLNYAAGKELTKLMSDHGFTSALAKQRTFRFAPGIYWQNDYIFQRECDVEGAVVKRVAHSDHYPIFFDVSLRSEALIGTGVVA